MEKTYCNSCGEITEHDIHKDSSECMGCGMEWKNGKGESMSEKEVDIKKLILELIHAAHVEEKVLEGFQIMEQLRGKIVGENSPVHLEEALISKKLSDMKRARTPLIERTTRGGHEMGPLAIRFGLWTLTDAGLELMNGGDSDE